MRSSFHYDVSIGRVRLSAHSLPYALLLYLVDPGSGTLVRPSSSLIYNNTVKKSRHFLRVTHSYIRFGLEGGENKNLGSENKDPQPGATKKKTNPNNIIGLRGRSPEQL